MGGRGHTTSPAACPQVHAGENGHVVESLKPESPKKVGVCGHKESRASCLHLAVPRQIQHLPSLGVPAGSEQVSQGSQHLWDPFSSVTSGDVPWALLSHSSIFPRPLAPRNPEMGWASQGTPWSRPLASGHPSAPVCVSPSLCVAQAAAANRTRDFPQMHTLDSNQSTMEEGHKRSLSVKTRQRDSKLGPLSVPHTRQPHLSGGGVALGIL